MADFFDWLEEHCPDLKVMDWQRKYATERFVKGLSEPRTDDFGPKSPDSRPKTQI